MQIHRLVILALGNLAIAASSTAGPVFPPLGRLVLIALETNAGWILESSADGSDQLTSVSLTPPGKAPLAFDCEASGPDAARCEYDDATPVASLAALLVEFPAGTWLLTVNGTLGAELIFDPVEPSGTLTVTSPPNGAVGVGATPSIQYTHDCSNCNFLLLELEPEPGGFEIELLIEGEPPASPGTVTYEEFEITNGLKPDTLPAGLYQLLGGTLVATLGIETLAQGMPGEQTFQFVRGAERDVRTFFTVPEPASVSLAAIATLAAIARRRSWLP